MVSRIRDDIFGMLFPVCKMASIFNLHARRCMATVHYWLLSLCALYYVDLARTDTQPAKPGGVWVCDCLPIYLARNPKLSRPFWNRFSCDDLSYDGSDDWKRHQSTVARETVAAILRKGDLSVEDWAYSVTHCMEDARKSVYHHLVGYAAHSEQLF